MHGMHYYSLVLRPFWASSLGMDVSNLGDLDDGLDTIDPFVSCQESTSSLRTTYNLRVAWIRADATLAAG